MKFLFWPLMEPVMVALVGVANILEGVIMEL
jgi:hypothetical protein